MSTPQIRPIPTTYNDTQYRSRLEARWAVILDQLRIPYQYEHEAYALPSGNYLPDFWLPTVDGGTWLEIKGQEPTSREEQLMRELNQATGKQGILAWGPIPDLRDWYDYSSDSAYVWGAHDPDFYNHHYWDNNYMLTICPHCQAPTFQFMGSVEYAGRHCGSEKPATDHAQERLQEAFQAGRTYRFWEPKK